MKRRSIKLSPVLVATLVAVWLLLNETFAPGQVLLGLVLALGVGWAASALRPLRPRMRRLHLAVALAFVIRRRSTCEFADGVASSVSVSGPGCIRRIGCGSRSV